MSARHAAAGLMVVALIFGFPAAQIAVHGFDFSLWPDNIPHPSVWMESWVSSYGLKPLTLYADLLLNRTNSVGVYGRTAFLCIFIVPAFAIGVCFVPPAGPRRDPRALKGDARWATRKERAQMRIGLELGLDAVTSRPIRVMVESHLVTIAAPRTGKTSGLLIPNLAAPDSTSWFGPAVVFDPKGEAYRAVAERRRGLGRKVRCFDPKNIAGGTDTWNPLKTFDPKDIFYLQRVARVLLPQDVSGEAVYFQNRAVVVIVGAFLAAQEISRAKPATPTTPAKPATSVTPAKVAWLLANVNDFSKALAPIKGVAAGNAKAILAMEPKARDAILSTAAQAFEWCADERLQRTTSVSSFHLSDLCKGETDLFIALSTEDLETLAPLLRWLLCDLFSVVRRQRPSERIVCFIDEAATMFGGRFKEFLRVIGELPGHNLSIWSFWQTRSQLTDTFGAAGAQTVLNTAEITTFSDLPLIDPDERELISRSIGDYSNLEEVPTRDVKTGTTSVSTQTVGVRLLTADAVGQVPTSDHIIFPNSKLYAKRPLQIRKTAHDDSRLTGIVTSLAGSRH